MVRVVRFVLGMVFALPLVAVAQVPTRPPTTPPTTPNPVRPAATPARPDTVPRVLRTRADTLKFKADSAKADSTRADSATKANFAPPDSVMQRLMSQPGYDQTRYQSETITFDAKTKGFQLTKKAIVEKDSQLVKSDTIKYSGSGSTIEVGSDPRSRGNTFVTPGQAPVFSSGAGKYDIASRRAKVSGVKTKIPQSGEELTITAEKMVFVASKDTTEGKNAGSYFGKGGTISACPDSIPDYYFKVGEIKRTGTFVVARPAVLYIGDVPVMWLPFLFQDIRNGRHSGLIAPNLGVSDFIRNSKSYRRSIEGLGYYFAISDFIDAQASVDWRSSAGESQLGDQGYVRANGEFRYRWLDRFVTGNVALSRTQQGGAINKAVTWGHQQSFSRNSSFTMNLNLVENTQLQRQTTINPYAVQATISSSANYQQKLGPAQISLGGSQKQYPGRTQLDRQFPTLSITTSPLTIASWLSWTPSISYDGSQQSGIDQPTQLGLLLRPGKTAAGIDTIFGDTAHRSASTKSLRLDMPIQIFGKDFGNQISISSKHNAFPELAIVTDVVTGVETERIYAETYNTEINWTPVFTLPPLARNNFNLTTSFSLSNVDGAAFAIRNERTNGVFVHQAKRPTFGLSAAPTLFGLFNGFGPFQRLRHSVTPTLGYTFAPQAEVSNEFLAAIGRTKYNRTTGDTTGYLGALRQNALSFGLSTNIEAKLRSKNDSNPEEGDKIKLITVNFSPLAYDFERAAYTGSRIRGLTTENFNYTVRSDLLPGLDIGVDYSLFEGSAVSDSAKFSPYRERISAGFSFSNTANPFAVFARMFGKAVPPSAPSTDRLDAPGDDRYARQVASQPVAGRAARTAAYIPSASQGWKASFTFAAARQRPPVNARNVVAFDPTLQCQALNTPQLRIPYEACVANAAANPSPPTPITSGLVGSPIYLTQPTTSLGSNISFNLTEHWAGTWQTQYDFVAKDFASQVVSLQRDLHDWRAIFAFTKSPNGSFAFNFLISLKAEPDLKFDYHKSTFRNEGLTGLTP
ncbi:MAG: putative LPS assembly protein LptD [Gemmatimonadota bacterium]